MVSYKAVFDDKKKNGCEVGLKRYDYKICVFRQQQVANEKIFFPYEVF